MGPSALPVRDEAWSSCSNGNPRAGADGSTSCPSKLLRQCYSIGADAVTAPRPASMDASCSPLLSSFSLLSLVDSVHI